MKTIILSILCLVSFNAYSQIPEIGSLKYLDYKNGYMDIILGSDISTLKGKVKSLSGSTPDKDGNITYDVTDLKYLSLGEVKMKNVSVITFEDKIIHIMIDVQPQYDFKLYEVLRQGFGMYTDKPNRFMDKYIWETSKVKVIYQYDNKKPFLWYMDLALWAKNREYTKNSSKKIAEDLK